MAQDVQSATVLASLLGREAKGKGQAMRLGELEKIIEAEPEAAPIDPQIVESDPEEIPAAEPKVEPEKTTVPA